ncbi:MAG: transglycosylase SLT domain-containing protein [Candidatus Cloacimonetes bacterium]|jgi:soluble lytic murein transglycosylase|nr:transglycosylase SLT domain-containing protein [Candidatus Cloacimonadota bacterium]MDY0298633.1 transglycosylase SLT domain-containing protein [Candidatus Cloacimonadaceae bacterium]MCB5279318.1 transglycosylase SLT domain-containing protein [Candidatus Cloacimonadota bacterium]MCK9331902.1 transglycosylase SLT domain-containing protein [Candidatus Cloacimonadota bacterium]MDD2211023.1 transglycosylase SLT domain-containing protein [Candidatus Cloacimonadota bacterium]
MAKRKKKNIGVCLVTILLLAIILTYNPVSIRIMTVGVAVWYRIDPAVFYRLIRTESSFRSFAISPKSAIGLGQMKESTALYVNKEHKRGLLFVPVYNLRLSACYLNYLKNKYNGNWSLVLAAYNWGESNVSRRVKNLTIDPHKNYRDTFRDIPETWNYIGKILPDRKKA